MHPDFVHAPEMLPLPRFDGLRPKQRGGRQCVWCDDEEPTVKLGPRFHALSLTRWFPAACRACAAREAARVRAIHVTKCARCTHRDHCPDERALYELSIVSRPRRAVRRPRR